MIDPYDPNWKMDREESQGSTDLDSLLSGPEPVSELPMLSAEKLSATDFASLRSSLNTEVKFTPPRTWTDTLIDMLTPTLILVLVYAVIFFLLDVRYVYTAVHDQNLRFVAFAFVLGVVALNRMMARDGSGESIIYMIGLAGAIGLYTLSTTGGYDVGSLARNFMNSNAYLATAFNMGVVVFIWWLVNRLTHECCVDENRVAGEVGILTGTARRLQGALKKDPEAEKKHKVFARKQKETQIYRFEMEAYDPVTDFEPVREKKPAVARRSTSDRLRGRHPGMAIFYFSVPVMAIFAVGLRVVQHGGERFVWAGKLYMGVYTVCALFLLLLTSLAGLREYFRARKVAMPGAIGFFWVGLGLVMIFGVLTAATQLPMPGLPPLAHVDEHVVDPWDRGMHAFSLIDTIPSPESLEKQQRVVQVIGRGVLALFGFLVVFALLKALGVWAARIARERDRYPRFVVRFFDRVERIISKLTRLPEVSQRQKRVRIQRDIATCGAFRNSLGEPTLRETMRPNDHVAYAYQALCALAYDLGVPKRPGQTAYEFARAFPKEMEALRKEAVDLTYLYVHAEYAPGEMSPKVEDQLRRFWIRYERARARILR